MKVVIALAAGVMLVYAVALGLAARRGLAADGSRANCGRLMVGVKGSARISLGESGLIDITGIKRSCACFSVMLQDREGNVRDPVGADSGGLAKVDSQDSLVVSFDPQRGPGSITAIVIGHDAVGDDRVWSAEFVYDGYDPVWWESDGVITEQLMVGTIVPGVTETREVAIVASADVEIVDVSLHPLHDGVGIDVVPHFEEVGARHTPYTIAVRGMREGFVAGEIRGIVKVKERSARVYEVPISLAVAGNVVGSSRIEPPVAYFRHDSRSCTLKISAPIGGDSVDTLSWSIEGLANGKAGVGVSVEAREGHTEVRMTLERDADWREATLLLQLGRSGSDVRWERRVPLRCMH